MINILIFRCADLKTEDYDCCFADWLNWNNSPDCVCNKKLNCLGLMNIRIMLDITDS